MWSVKGGNQRLCGGIARRDFLALGALGGLGLTLPDLHAARAFAEHDPVASFGRARRCLLLYLTGGPPQHDTWDPKPAAPERIRGEFRPIASNVPGIHVAELFPRLARHMDKVCLVRSVTHGDRTHTSAGYTMLTGMPHPNANAQSATSIRPSPHDHPHVGALLARVRPARRDVPTFVSLPEVIKDDAINEFPGQDAGFLGRQFAPFRIEGNAGRTGFTLPDLHLPPGMTGRRLADRRVILDHLERTLRRLPADSVNDMDRSRQQAFDLLASPAMRRALALDQEPPANRERYGAHLFGQGCLLARRLLEAGVGLVTVYWHYEGPQDSPVWDTHQNNFRHLRERLIPPTDQALSAVLSDLDQRGMLADTLVLCMGEFGRTPLVNRQAGRDHWAAAQSILLAGAGVRRGIVYGASDRDGALPADRPVSPADLTATILHLLGVPADLEVHDRTQRPFRACTGTPVAGILR